MQNYKIFGESCSPHFIPKELLTPFSVIGNQNHWQEAIDYTFATLREHQRIQSLLLIFFSHLDSLLIPNQQKLTEILKNGCKIYFFVSKDSFSFEECNYLSQFGLVIAF
ncbi:hypothetical protein [Helicobacter canadensis]|uniref:Uncharacterized protein n=1 Tax=Helicobacter canadensis MIT 98-5491 TaxID=537970 RepID=C5ZWL2_9HELI|nr:hypothetical protein [Helicobacter canadensis]EES89530.1 hypothetical protein HCAN_0816 [Helicobacter canadensis MIT 98-5491]EFR48321.1 hypothetical protein HCMG_00494 [Helicobacter canadensis MIT 98-5491]STO99567.1 Uncharacterised protein [Helicobacter canadensis]